MSNEQKGLVLLGYFSGIILHRYMEIKSYTMKSGSSHETNQDLMESMSLSFFRGSGYVWIPPVEVGS